MGLGSAGGIMTSVLRPRSWNLQQLCRFMHHPPVGCLTLTLCHTRSAHALVRACPKYRHLPRFRLCTQHSTQRYGDGDDYGDVDDHGGNDHG